eukprot:scaffold159372_cov23-Cyclotella_meneghiniana.AAC.1
MLTNCHTFVAHVFAAFNRFLKRHGSQKKYTDDSIDSVSQDLLDANAPTVLITLETLNSSQDVNNPSGYRERLAKKKAMSAISRMKYAALTIPEDSAVPADSTSDSNPDTTQDNAGDHDDSTAADEEIDLTEAEMEQATDQANMFYSAVIEQNSYTGDKDDLYNTLLFQAMSSIRQHRGPCEVCDGDHSADICDKRGKAFQPDWMQKRVAQKNLIDGAIHPRLKSYKLPHLPGPVSANSSSQTKKFASSHIIKSCLLAILQLLKRSLTLFRP